MIAINPPVCRLCGEKSAHAFQINLLKKYQVDYTTCLGCGSLQTQAPYWLDEAYANSLAALDTGAAQRNLTNLAAVSIAAFCFGFTNILDFGGGDGLLCRFLRDYGLNCFLTDKYASSSYAQGYTTPNFTKPDLLVAFEVLEHFPNPKEDVAALFETRPTAVLCTTEIFRNQDSTWWYLTPETGQHVFFYSPKALSEIAYRFGYRLYSNGSYLLFVDSQGPKRFREGMVALLMNRYILRLTRAALALAPTPGVWKDFQAMRGQF